MQARGDKERHADSPLSASRVSGEVFPEVGMRQAGLLAAGEDPLAKLGKHGQPGLCNALLLPGTILWVKHNELRCAARRCTHVELIMKADTWSTPEVFWDEDACGLWLALQLHLSNTHPFFQLLNSDTIAIEGAPDLTVDM